MAENGENGNFGHSEKLPNGHDYLGYKMGKIRPHSDYRLRF